MNKAILIGRLTKDPELTTTNGGISVCRFTLAVDRAFKNAEGERQADFLPIVVWRQQADNCGKYLFKGSQCAVTGTVQTRSYDATDGTKRYVTEIVADNVEFLGKANSNSSASNQDPDEQPAPKAKKKMDELKVVDDDTLPF